MNPHNKWLKITGIVLNTLIGLMLVASSVPKLFGLIPDDPQHPNPLKDQLLLIGCGELITGLLLIIPWTTPFGTLMASGFWGGAICFHMTQHENYAVQSTLLAVTWIGSYLRGSVRLWWLDDAPAPPTQ